MDQGRTAETELAADVAAVGLDGVLRNGQLLSNVTGRTASAHQLKDFPFPGGEQGQIEGGGGPGRHALRELTRGGGLATLLAIMVATSAAAGRLDGRYCNARFGFCLNLPYGMTAQAEPANGDGRQFRQAGGLEAAATRDYSCQM